MKIKGQLIDLTLSIIVGLVISYIPIICSEKLAFITILSIIPIYIISRKSPSIGLISYILTFLLIAISNQTEGIRFLFINGLLGLFLGMFSYYIRKKVLMSLLMGGILYISINGMCNIVNINTINDFCLNTLMIQFIAILLCVLYSLITLIICDYLYKKI